VIYNPEVDWGNENTHSTTEGRAKSKAKINVIREQYINNGAQHNRESSVQYP